MTDFEPVMSMCRDPHDYLVLSDGAFDQARAEGITRLALDTTVVKEVATQIELPPHFLPTMVVVGLVTDGISKNRKLLGTYQDIDPPTYVAGASLYEEAPRVVRRLGAEACCLGCQSLPL